jgi:flagellar basal-body rod modification protein FlgD
MLPVLTAIGAGLSALSALKNLTSSSSDKSAANAGAAPTAAQVAKTQADAAGGTAATAASGGEMQDRFLKLLVTQMKNQDPLNPLDNAQVTSQLAQISTVGGIDKLNTTISALSTSLLASQSMQSASVIGRDVYAVGSTLNLNGKATGGFDLKQDADRVFVSITNGAGSLVRTLQLPAAKAGLSAFEWDGMTDGGVAAPNGAYVFQLTAARGNNTIPVEPLMAGRVGGVSLGNGVKLNLEGGGEIGMADLKRIL